MRAHYFQHVPFEGLGSIQPWLQNAGYEITGTRFFDADALPNLADIDLLVILGGPMSVNDEKELPWLIKEKEFIRRAIDANKPVLGICLGAQLIASALGGKVFPNAVKEIGWFPIQNVAAGHGAVFQFPAETEVFHWHGETFSLPPGAVPLAQSAGCANQAFQLGKHVIGLQFHLETTPASAQALVDHCGHELVTGQYIQSATEILSAPPERYAAINSLMERVLGYLQERYN